MIIIVYILILAIYVLFLIYYLSLIVRRFHDLGKSGWYTLLYLVPVVNIITLIYLLGAKGEEGSNKYGESNIGQPFWSSVFKG
jgi:uncharacterized membrane protein YhaH (DUF805 family)